MNSKRILIVDDEGDLRRTLKETFEYFGWQADEAEDGKMAYDKIREQNYDLVLSDIKMPHVDGIQFLKMLDAQFKSKVPIYMISAYSDVNESYIIALGAKKIFPKPISLYDLIRELDPESGRFAS